MGFAGTFNYDLHVSIFLSGAQKVYNTHQRCDVGFGEASALSQVLGTVDNVKQLDQMTDAQIQATFDNAAALCAQELVLRMRRHASSNKAPILVPAAPPPAAPPPEEPPPAIPAGSAVEGP